MERDRDIDRPFGTRMNTPAQPGDGTKEQNFGDDSLIGSPSDYVLIAMIIAMMFCMTLCCLCLFCRSSSRFTICGINFELNERRNSVENGENQSEIHEVVPLTPATAGDYTNRLPEIESMLKGDAPPMYDDLVKKAEAASQEENSRAVDMEDSSKAVKKKFPSESSSARTNRGRRSWRFSGSGLLASFRAMRSRRSDDSIQCPTVEEGVTTETGTEALPPLRELTPRQRAENLDDVTVETVNEVIKEAETTEKQTKVFVYDANDLPNDDDDVFL